LINIKKLLVILVCLTCITGISYGAYFIYLNNNKHKLVNLVKTEQSSIQSEESNQGIIQKQENKNVDISTNIDKVKIDTIKTIVNVHEFLNNQIGGDNKPTDLTYKLSKEYAHQLNELVSNEDWDYLKYDLQRSALNLEYASINKDKQCLIIAHRILHDLDAHVLNKNDLNYNKSSFGDSQTYRLTHQLPSNIPTKLPPPGV
jgi:hypothetical protein